MALFFLLIAFKAPVPDESIVLVVVLACLHTRSLFHRALLFTVMRWIGIRCYGIYLLHHPILYILENYRREGGVTVERTGLDPAIFYSCYFAVCASVVLICAGLTFRFFERPMMKVGEMLILKLPKL